jgi:hypothetical protein
MQTLLFDMLVQPLFFFPLLALDPGHNRRVLVHRMLLS